MLQRIVAAVSPDSVLDVGVGAGKIGKICEAACPHCKVIGVEAHGPYADQFASQWEAYERVHIADIMAWSLANASARFDLVVFGDVLEHMWLNDAMSLLRFWSARSKFMVAIWPSGFQQDAHGGVLSEIHRCEIRLADLVGTGIDIVRYHKHYRTYPGHSKSLAVIRGIQKTDRQQGVAY